MYFAILLLCARNVDVECSKKDHRISLDNLLNLIRMQAQHMKNVFFFDFYYFSGLLFLRNYLRKKNANLKKFDENGVDVEGGTDQQKPTTFFNSVPVPFPPRDDFYGPLYIPDELVSFQTRFPPQHFLINITFLLFSFPQFLMFHDNSVGQKKS